MQLRIFIMCVATLLQLAYTVLMYVALKRLADFQ